MTTIDVSKVPHLEARRKALAAQVESDRISADRDADPAIKALTEKRRAEHDRLYGEMNAALKMIDDEIAELEAPYDARMDALESDGEIEFRRDWDCDCRLKICVLSGLPIIEDEEVVEDCDVTGGLIIRALLPFPAEVESA